MQIGGGKCSDPSMLQYYNDKYSITNQSPDIQIDLEEKGRCQCYIIIYFTLWDC